MKTLLESEDIQAIATAAMEMLKPMLYGNCRFKHSGGKVRRVSKGKKFPVNLALFSAAPIVKSETSSGEGSPVIAVFGIKRESY